MLKRCQVLLTDWQVEHYKLVAKKYDLSFSEMIRMALCLDTLYATENVFPKFHSKIDKKVLLKVIKSKKIKSEMSEEKFHELISKIYFETRKAAEMWEKELENNSK